MSNPFFLLNRLSNNFKFFTYLMSFFMCASIINGAQASPPKVTSEQTITTEVVITDNKPDTNDASADNTDINIAQAITVTNGYLKKSIPGSSVTAAYMTINNQGDKSIALTKVTSTISDRIEIHEHTMSDGMMRMREVGRIVIDARSSQTLKPYGLHLMIFDVKQPLTEPDSVLFTLYFTDNTKLNIQLPVSQFK